jgi:hypothetical protein
MRAYQLGYELGIRNRLTYKSKKDIRDFRLADAIGPPLVPRFCV